MSAILYNYVSFLVGLQGPETTQRGPDRPESTPVGPETTQRGPETTQRGPQTPQRGPGRPEFDPVVPAPSSRRSFDSPQRSSYHSSRQGGQTPPRMRRRLSGGFV